MTSEFHDTLGMNFIMQYCTLADCQYVYHVINTILNLLNVTMECVTCLCIARLSPDIIYWNNLCITTNQLMVHAVGLR